MKQVARPQNNCLIKRNQLKEKKREIQPVLSQVIKEVKGPLKGYQGNWLLCNQTEFLNSIVKEFL